MKRFSDSYISSYNTLSCSSYYTFLWYISGKVYSTRLPERFGGKHNWPKICLQRTGVEAGALVTVLIQNN